MRRGKGIPERLAMLVSMYSDEEVRVCVGMWFEGGCWMVGWMVGWMVVG